jgi:hypothetical protein
LFILSSFLKITQVGKFLGNFFPRLKSCINFDEKCVGLHFGRFYYIQTRLVTLTPSNVSRAEVWSKLVWRKWPTMADAVPSWLSVRITFYWVTRTLVRPIKKSYPVFQVWKIMRQDICTQELPTSTYKEQ